MDQLAKLIRASRLHSMGATCYARRYRASVSSEKLDLHDLVAVLKHPTVVHQTEETQDDEEEDEYETETTTTRLLMDA